MSITDSLADSCYHTLGNQGRLATAIPGFKSRAGQSNMAQEIAWSISQKTTLVVEAGTGTGKTYAYLVPCLLSGKKVLISTATKTLQDQLYHKDLPLLLRSLALSTSIQNLKGRANYICKYRVHLHTNEHHIDDSLYAHEIAHVSAKMAQMQHGDRSELPELAEDSPVWPFVTSTSENCLGTDCSYYDECFLVKARRKAMAADVVVINHHLFFADSRLKNEGFGELLPGVDVVVFDEAHQLAEIATHFYEHRIGTRQFSDLFDDIIKEWPSLDRYNQSFKSLRFKLNAVIDELLNSVKLINDKISWNAVQNMPQFKKNWQQWAEIQTDLLSCFDPEVLKENPGLNRCKERLDAFHTVFSSFSEYSKNTICWLECFKYTLICHATPYHIKDFFGQLIQTRLASYIFTSATLTIADSFICFTQSLGLEHAKTMLLPSPFNYKEHALLYMPRSLPDPKHVDYYDVLLQRTIPLINLLKGRCFFLFTSHRALKHVAPILTTLVDFPILVQGEEAKPILLERFRNYGNAVLCGTSTFWEGVDVKGDALSCVIIDKIPFSSPVDPIIRGKIDYLKAHNLSGFDDLLLPNAVIALKQGIGRLIRDNNDKGLLVIADPRLGSREYGRRIFASLPELTKTRDEQKVIQFINSLVQNYETFSD